MLVLSRKTGQKVMIGDGITLVVKRILGQRVTFGIEAPDTVRIVRGELPIFEEPPRPTRVRREAPSPRDPLHDLAWGGRPR
jgi:carbon storage regulator